MNNVYVRLRNKGKNNKYQKMLSTKENIYPSADELITSTNLYSPGATLEDGEWFEIKDASKQSYAMDLLSQNYQSVDFDSLNRQDFTNIDFIFVSNKKYLFFQNISKSRLVAKKRIGSFGDGFKYDSDCSEIVINNLPDAIYCKKTDTLFFNKLESITSIFKGIDQLYREATEEETAKFLKSNFICLKDGYSSSKVKTANRKRIALAERTLSALNEADQKNIFKYIGEYCPDLATGADAFEIGTENELKMLLYGIEQRFYTTSVGGEQRIANSVIPFTQK